MKVGGRERVRLRARTFIPRQNARHNVLFRRVRQLVARGHFDERAVTASVALRWARSRGGLKTKAPSSATATGRCLNSSSHRPRSKTRSPTSWTLSRTPNRDVPCAVPSFEERGPRPGEVLAGCEERARGGGVGQEDPLADCYGPRGLRSPAAGRSAEQAVPGAAGLHAPLLKTDSSLSFEAGFRMDATTAVLSVLATVVACLAST